MHTEKATLALFNYAMDPYAPERAVDDTYLADLLRDPGLEEAFRDARIQQTGLEGRFDRVWKPLHAVVTSR
ncbi:hypothetical protein [Streptomyces sp. NPDC001450]